MGEEWEMPNSWRRDWIQSISEVARSKMQYSTSVLEPEMTSYFLAHRGMRFLLRKTHALEVERLSYGSEPKSASQNAWREMGEIHVGSRWSPQEVVP